MKKFFLFLIILVVSSTCFAVDISKKITVLPGANTSLAGSYDSKKKEKLYEPFTLHAVYNKADGLNIGNSVRLAGIEVAKVSDVHLDDFHHVKATFTFSEEINLPIDSIAIIGTDSYTGDKYIELLPGDDEKMFQKGDTFSYTQDGVSLDNVKRILMSQATDNFILQASFTNVGGLKTGTDVQINGIKVGSVTKIELDKDTYQALVEMTIKDTVRLPIDTIAVIADSGIMGDKYIRLEPGKSLEKLQSNSRMMKTKPYKSLEDNVREFIFLSTQDDAQK